MFEDPTTYNLRIRSAAIAIDTLSLSRLLNRHVLGYKGAPIRDVHIRVDQDEIVQQGKMGAVSFTIRSKPSVNEDGRIRLHPTDVKVLGISVEGLMKTFGMTLEKSLHLKEERGLSIDKNDLLLDPAKMLPPPRISGRLRAVTPGAGPPGAGTSASRTLWPPGPISGAITRRGTTCTTKEGPCGSGD